MYVQTFSVWEYQHNNQQRRYTNSQGVIFMHRKFLVYIVTVQKNFLFRSSLIRYSGLIEESVTCVCTVHVYSKMTTIFPNLEKCAQIIYGNIPKYILACCMKFDCGFPFQDSSNLVMRWHSSRKGMIRVRQFSIKVVKKVLIKLNHDIIHSTGFEPGTTCLEVQSATN